MARCRCRLEAIKDDDKEVALLESLLLVVRDISRSVTVTCCWESPWLPPRRNSCSMASCVEMRADCSATSRHSHAVEQTNMINKKTTRHELESRSRFKAQRDALEDDMVIELIRSSCVM